MSSEDGWMDYAILITPCREHEAWLSRLGAAAKAIGLQAVFQHFGEFDPADSPAERLFITTNRSILRPSHGRPIAVISSHVVTAFRQTSEILGSNGHDALVDASRLMVDAADVSTLYWFNEDALYAAPSKAIEILPGLKVEPPPLQNVAIDEDLDVAAAEVLSLFAKGRPGPGAKAEWSPIVFLYDSRREASRTIRSRLDMTGPPCSLVHGPDLHLPAGRWRAVGRFSIDDLGSRHDLQVEWGPSGDYRAFQIRPGRSGVFSVSIEHVWASPSLVEFRIRLSEGCMDGTFEFLGVQIEFLGP